MGETGHQIVVTHVAMGGTDQTSIVTELEVYETDQTRIVTEVGEREVDCRSDGCHMAAFVSSRAVFKCIHCYRARICP